MFTLTSREQILLASILAAAVLGAAVKHWRDAQREGRVIAAPAVTATSPSPSGRTTAKVVEH